MNRITRREAVGAILTSAAGLAVVRHVAGCSAPAVGPGGNANDNTDSVDPALRGFLDIEDIDHLEGDPAAPNVIIQYGDFESAECGAFFRDNRPAVFSELVESGQVRFVFRHFPLSAIHPNARLAAIAAECAVDFFEYHDLLFENQAALTRDDLIAYAGQVGLNTNTFGSCLDAGSKAPRVQRDIDSATALAIVETPTFFVNARILVGNRTVQEFEGLLD